MEFILRQFPHARKQIETALARGFSPDKIIKYLAGGRNEVNKPITEHEKTRAKDVERQRNIQSNIGKGAALAGTAILGGRALQAGAGVLGSMMGGQSSPQPQPTPGMPPSPSTQGIAPSPSPTPGPNIAQSISQQASAPVEQAKHGQTPIPEAPLQNTQFDAGTFLQGIGQKDMVDAMKSKNPPELIAGIVRNRLGKNVQEAERMAGAPIEKIIADYIQSTPQEQPQQQPQGLPQAPAPAQEPIQPTVKEILPTEEKPKRSLDISISKEGKLSPTAEKTNEALFPKKKMRPLTSVTYEQKYKDLSPEEIKTFRIIDDAVDKTAKHLVSGKTFQDLLPMKEDSKIQLSTAEDVLRSLVGIPSKYNLLSDEEQENVFNTFQGITPNIIWNTISLIDPRIQKIQRPNPSPKGGKQGKTEVSSNDFRRMLAHSVIGMMEKEKDFGPRVKMITSVIDMVNKFSDRKSQAKAFPEFQELSDEEFSSLMEAVPEEEVKKFR
jgi:hypothetical protein